MVLVAVIALAVVGCGAWLLWPRGYERVDTPLIELRVGQTRTLHLGSERSVPYQHRVVAVDGESVTAQIVVRGLSPLERLRPRASAPGSATGEVGLRVEGRSAGTATVTTALCRRGENRCQKPLQETVWYLVIR